MYDILTDVGTKMRLYIKVFSHFFSGSSIYPFLLLSDKYTSAQVTKSWSYSMNFGQSQVNFINLEGISREKNRYIQRKKRNRLKLSWWLKIGMQAGLVSRMCLLGSQHFSIFSFSKIQKVQYFRGFYGYEHLYSFLKLS